MKKDIWSEKYGCYKCSFCDEPQGNRGIYNKKTGVLIRFCKEHEKIYEKQFNCGVDWHKTLEEAVRCGNHNL